MPRIMGVSAYLDEEERIGVEDFVRFVGQFEGKTEVVFIHHHREVKLHAIQYSNRDGILKILLKEAPNIQQSRINRTLYRQSRITMPRKS